MEPNNESAQPFLRIKRQFDVPPSTVFDTLTKPSLLPIWWGEAKFDIDLKVGGQWTIIRHDDGVEHLATGTYQEVERPTRLQYTFGMPEFSPDSDLISVTIQAIDGGSIMVFEHSGVGIAAELNKLSAGGWSPSEAGWQQGFDLMAAEWSKQ
jgi:uncharacterized protein YndB with AHSA1/START domain